MSDQEFTENVLSQDETEELIDIIGDNYLKDEGVLWDKIIEFLSQHQAKFAERNVDIAEHARKYFDHVILIKKHEMAKEESCIGKRVHVESGDLKTNLGEGTYLGSVTTYVIDMPDGSLRSLENAEEMPPPELIPEGAEIRKLYWNPKIRLDSGEIVYGCQIWWSFAE